MGCHCLIDGGITRVEFAGNHDFEDEIRTLRLGCRGFGMLLDISGSKRSWTSEEASTLAGVFEGSRSPRRCAVVVEGALQYGLARMFASYAEFKQVPVRVFSDGVEAEAWLKAGSSA